MTSNGGNGADEKRGFVNRNAGPSVPLAQVYARVNPKGQRYLVGRVGTAKLLIVETDEISQGERIWQVILGEGRYTPEGVAEALERKVEEEGATR